MADLTETDLLNMDDETFLKTNPVPEAPPVPAEKVETPTETEVEVSTEAEVPAEKTEGDDTQVEDDASKTEETDESAETEESKAAKAAADRARDEQGRFTGKDGKPAPAKDANGKDISAVDATKVATEVQPTTTIDHKSFYERVMTPFKANGRTIELKSPEEVVQLMQMGANYTKKMQELVPHRKIVTMLQNNGLLDEGKLSYLIDLDKKNPEAIKKLVKDAGLDPMEIDTSAESAYREGNHRVSDEEVSFSSALDDMKSTPERVKTLQVIDGGWDQASKEALWKSPEIMGVIHQQRENGIYDRIANEVVRRQTLGAVPANVPFLQAYKIVGDEMMAANKFADILKPPAPVAVTPLATTVAAPKPKVGDNERAASASSTRQTPSNSKAPFKNPLAMSDEEFLKQFEGRL